MSHEPNHDSIPGHGKYELRDVGTSGILYFFVALILAGVAVYFIVNGVFAYLNKRYEANQQPASPLVTNAPADTRHIPPQYHGNYEQYLKDNFPAPQLEINERTELNAERLREEDTLSTYGWVDQQQGIVRIPIDRAIDILAQRGLPVRSQATPGQAATQAASAQPQSKKGTRK